MDEFIYEEIAVGGGNRNLSLGIHSKQRLYNSPRIEVHETEAFGLALYLDGSLQTTEKDEHYYHETLAHSAYMRACRQVKNVLIIGGGDGGTLREVLKWPDVQHVTLCEINPEVIDVSVYYFPAFELEKNKRDSRVNVVIADANDYCRNYITQSGPFFDVVLIDCNDPSHESSVLYTRDFLENVVRRLLAADGSLAIQAGNAFINAPFVRKVKYEMSRLFDCLEYAYAPIPSFPGGGIGFMIGYNEKETHRFSAFSKLCKITKAHELKFFTENTFSGMLKIAYPIVDFNKRRAVFDWYCETQTDLKTWSSDAEKDLIIAFEALDGEERGAHHQALMSIEHCVRPAGELKDERISSPLMFLTNEPSRVKDAVMHVLAERGAIAPDFPIHGVSFNKPKIGLSEDIGYLYDEISIHQLISLEQLKTIYPEFYNDKPEPCHDNCLLTTVFLGNGESFDTEVTFYDLTREYKTGDRHNVRPPRIMNKVTQSASQWRDRLEPSGQKVLDAALKKGLSLEAILWGDRSRANLRVAL